MTNDAPCTHVRDHLLGVDIPVRYVDPGTETLADEMAALEALARTAQAINAEIDAMHTDVIAGMIADVNGYGRAVLGDEKFFAAPDLIWDHVDNALDRAAQVHAALVDTALALSAEASAHA